MRDCAGSQDNHATEECRGTQAADWPLDILVERGFGFAGFYSGDMDSDRAEVSDGIYAWLADNDPARNKPTNRGLDRRVGLGFSALRGLPRHGASRRCRPHCGGRPFAKRQDRPARRALWTRGSR